MGDGSGPSTGGWTGRRIGIVALPVVAVVGLVAFLLLRGDDDTAVGAGSSDQSTVPRGSSTTATTGVAVPSTDPAASLSTVPGGAVATTVPPADAPVTTAASTGAGGRVQVKFADGSGVRLRDGGFVSVTGQDLASLQAVLDRYPVSGIDRLFQRPEEDLAAEKAAIEARTGQPAPDLNLYFRVTLGPGADAAAFITELQGLDFVGSAYRDPVAAPPPSPGAYRR